MNRDIEIDIAKGLAIFLVVAGHIISKGTLSWKIIYLFHMPFFFIVSGYFHQVEQSPIKYFKKKFKSLLIPYFTYLLLFSLPSILGRLFNLITSSNNETVSSLIKNIFKLLYGGQSLGGYLAVFWFITCLFLTGQVFNFISLRVKSIKVIFIIAVLFYFLAYINQKYPQNFVLPWSANVVLCSFLFYFIGAVYGKYILKNNNTLLLFISIIINTLSLILVKSGYRLNFDMKYINYGTFIISPIVAIAWTKLLIFISSFLAKQNGLKPILIFFGTASITIMFLHEFFHYSLINFCDRWPWLMTVIIFFICCIFHFIFQKSTISRALLLGSRKDLALISSYFKRRIEH